MSSILAITRSRSILTWLRNLSGSLKSILSFLPVLFRWKSATSTIATCRILHIYRYMQNPVPVSLGRGFAYKGVLVIYGIGVGTCTYASKSVVWGVSLGWIVQLNAIYSGTRSLGLSHKLNHFGDAVMLDPSISQSIYLTYRHNLVHLCGEVCSCCCSCTKFLVSLVIQQNIHQ